ncbi:MAG: XRE family transcriptional regulator [Methylococcaceae bacterium]|nr:MAG: XRE family transcriptional regulator [Methylococcaceae bacterium]
MKTTKEYLEAAKMALDLPSDYAAAKWLGVTVQAMSKYKHGERIIDDYAAARIAEALKISPWEVVAAANYEREKEPKKKEYWRNTLTRAMAASVMIFAVFSGGYDNAEASEREYAQSYINFTQYTLYAINAPRQGGIAVSRMVRFLPNHGDMAGIHDHVLDKNPNSADS